MLPTGFNELQALWASMNPATVEPVAYIYGLSDPRTGCVRYIGQSVDAKDRYKKHLSNACYIWSERSGPTRAGTYKEHGPKSLWVRELRDAGLRPELVILGVVRNDAPTKDYFEAFFGLIYQDMDLLNEKPLLKTYQYPAQAA